MRRRNTRTENGAKMAPFACGKPTPMLYQIHEWQRSFLGPLSFFAQANARRLNDHGNPFAQMPGAQPSSESRVTT
jgi:hypothetical protein